MTRPAEHLLQLLCVRPRFSEVGASDSHLDRRRCSEAHHTADNVARLETETNAGKFLRQRPSQAFFEISDLYARFGVELHLQHGLFRTACPQIDGVDWLSGVLHANKSHSQFEILGSYLAANDIQRPVG